MFDYILLFLLSTGARLNEAMQAKWEQIYIQTRVLGRRCI